MSLLYLLFLSFLSFFLTPTFGLRGAAFSYALANIILFLSVWAYNKILLYALISKDIFKKYIKKDMCGIFESSPIRV